METPNLFEVNNKDNRTTPMTSMFATDFTNYFSVFIVDFEQVNTGWVGRYLLQVTIIDSSTRLPTDLAKILLLNSVNFHQLV